MRTNRTLTFVADFETTVYEGQTNTEVWAAAIVETFTEDVKVFNSIDGLFEYILGFKFSSIIYFHNLKFDGEFWLSYLLKSQNFSPAFVWLNEKTGDFKRRKEMKSGEFIYSISDKGLWYSVTIKNGPYYIELRDSLKLLPFSVAVIGQSFKTKHQKLSIEYTGFRKAGGEITEEEKSYIANDVLVVKEALEFMLLDGHDKMTIGSCCLEEFKARCPFQGTHTKTGLAFPDEFPNLYKIALPTEETESGIKYIFGSSNMGEYIRKSYRGGWCYAVEGKTGKIFTNGTTADVNSLYPSMMHSESGNAFPVGNPTFWIGNYIPDEAKDGKHYYFVRIKTQFELKPGYLPCIQIKGSPFYRPNEWLRTSDIKSHMTGEYFTKRRTLNGDIVDTSVELTLTQTDFSLIMEHYYLYNCEILDGCYFRSYLGVFDDYIDKYKKIKMSSKGAKRQLAKLFLNNLYGKMATSVDSSFKIAELKPDGSLGFKTIHKTDVERAGYIPIGTAITSYARNFTIRAAQKNYHGVDKPGFIYADTDSIHCDLSPNELQGIAVDDNDFCHWKLESCWDEAIFIRQKTYAEHITHENQVPVQNLSEPKEPYWEIKCAGMPEHCKELFLASLNPKTAELVSDQDWCKLLADDYSPEEILFLEKTRTIKDFDIGLTVPGKLMPVHFNGGILLMPTDFTMRRNQYIV